MRVCISSVALVSKKMFHETLNFGSHWSCELSACIPSTVTLWQKKKRVFTTNKNEKTVLRRRPPYDAITRNNLIWPYHWSGSRLTTMESSKLNL